MPGPPATLPGLVFLGAVAFALSVYLRGDVTAIWLPYLGLTLASAVVMVAVNVLVDLLFFPVLIYLEFRMKERSELYDRLGGSAEGALVADQH